MTDNVFAIIVLIIEGLVAAIPSIEEVNDYTDLIDFDEQ